jgi:hypothetical protein
MVILTIVFFVTSVTTSLTDKNPYGRLTAGVNGSPLVGGLVGGVDGPSRLGRPFNIRYPTWEYDQTPQRKQETPTLQDSIVNAVEKSDKSRDEVITKEAVTDIAKEARVDSEASKDLPKPFSGTPVGGSSVPEDLIGSERRGQKEVVQVGAINAPRYLDQDDTTYHSQQLSSRESVPLAYSRFENMNGRSTFGDIYFVGIIAGCSLVAVFGVMGTGYCLYKFNEHNKAALDVDYPAYGVTGPMAKVSSPITDHHDNSRAVRPDRIDNLSNGSGMSRSIQFFNTINVPLSYLSYKQPLLLPSRLLQGRLPDTTLLQTLPSLLNIIFQEIESWHKTHKCIIIIIRNNR